MNKAAAGFPQITADAHQTLQSLTKAGNAATGVAGDLQQTVRRINAPDGPLQQIAAGTQSLTVAADALGRSTLPRVNRAADDFSRASRSLSNMASRIGDNPQSVLYGAGAGEPGPASPVCGSCRGPLIWRTTSQEPIWHYLFTSRRDCCAQQPACGCAGAGRLLGLAHAARAVRPL